MSEVEVCTVYSSSQCPPASEWKLELHRFCTILGSPRLDSDRRLARHTHTERQIIRRSICSLQPGALNDGRPIPIDLSLKIQTYTLSRWRTAPNIDHSSPSKILPFRRTVTAYIKGTRRVGSRRLTAPLKAWSGLFGTSLGTRITRRQKGRCIVLIPSVLLFVLVRVRLRRQGEEGETGSQQPMQPARVACRKPGANKLDPPRTGPLLRPSYVPSAHPHPPRCILSARAHSNIAISATIQLVPPPERHSLCFLLFSSLPHPRGNFLNLPIPVNQLFNMASRPQNIGIKAIEIYFPSQVRACSSRLAPMSPPRRVLSPSTSANCSSRLGFGLVLTTSRAKIVCRAIRARAVRRRQCRQVHNWSWPDQDGFLR